MTNNEESQIKSRRSPDANLKNHGFMFLRLLF